MGTTDGVSERHRHRPRWRWIASASLVLAVIGAAGGWLWIRHEFDPTGSPFGTPRTIPLCGRSFSHSEQDSRIWTLAEVRAFEQAADVAPHDPLILEPTIGNLPILRPDVAWRPPAATCEMGIWLHVGTDAYVAYTLQGGP